MPDLAGFIEKVRATVEPGLKSVKADIPVTADVSRALTSLDTLKLRAAELAKSLSGMDASVADKAAHASLLSMQASTDKLRARLAGMPAGMDTRLAEAAPLRLEGRADTLAAKLEDMPVSADTGPMLAQVAAAEAVIAGRPVTVPVTADTSQLAAGLSSALAGGGAGLAAAAPGLAAAAPGLAAAAASRAQVSREIGTYVAGFPADIAALKTEAALWTAKADAQELASRAEKAYEQVLIHDHDPALVDRAIALLKQSEVK